MAIVGSGFAGLGMAIRLREAGIEDFVVLERADDVGGTWRDNTYPGLRSATCRRTCTRSRSRRTPTGRAPSRRSPRSGPTCAAARERYGVLPHIRFGHEVLDARWDEDASAGGSRPRAAT